MDNPGSSEAEKVLKTVTTSFEAMEMEDAFSGCASGTKPDPETSEVPKLLGRCIHPLTLFINFPTIDITVSDLETIVIARFILYRALERLNKKLYVKPFSSDWISRLKLDLINQGRQCHRSSLVDKAIDRICLLLQPKDHSQSNLKQSVWDESCSHFTLRFMYCRKENLKNYFIERELEWFRAKWSVLNLSGNITSHILNNSSCTLL